MAPDKSRYEPLPPIPSYDEAIGGGSSRPAFDASSPLDDEDELDHLDRHLDETEGRSLLNTRHPFDSTTTNSNPRARRPGGYRPPTVETDDEDSAWGSDSDDAEAAHVRREMQELEIEDLESDRRSLSSLWGKRMRFSLPQWRWSWRWRLPRFRIQLGQDDGSGEAANTSTGEERPRFALRGISASLLLLLVARVLIILIVLGLVYLLFVSDLFSSMARRMGQQMFDPESVRIHVQSAVDWRRMRETVQHFSSYAHIAGTEGDYALAIDTRNLFLEYGLEDVTVDEYYVYLNYPKEGGRAIEILGPDDKPIWTAKLEEDEVGGETAGRQTYVFHGHSKAGDVKGPLIYANYGSREDFKVLYDSGIDTRGAIALVRYYGKYGDRALKVKAAEEAGFAGCIIYSDPADDGFVNGPTAPNGRYMPADGVQRGAVSLMSWVVGDVLTPGWGSKKGVPRLEKEKSAGLVKIPSLPIAWRDAQVLLQHLKGVGQKVPDGWAGGVPDVGQWFIGNQSSPIVRLKNEQDEEDKQPIWNVYGRIVGIEQSEKRVIIGNHRDSWTFGSSDPHSGTAVMMELARIFGDLVARGWRPLRTIEFMSWDAEEYNLIGSTEYVEQNDQELVRNGLAYINLDTAIYGDKLEAAGSPVFRKLFLSILNRVGDPNYNTTLRDLWDRRESKIETLGAGSDYVAFQDIVGTSSFDLAFGSSAKFPYHSSYENFEWMDRIGDPGFTYHALLGQIVGLMVLELADRPIMPFDMAAYADDLPRWVEELRVWSENKGINQNGNAPFDLRVLRDAADEVAMAIREFEKWQTSWENSVVASSGWEPAGLGKQRAEYNSRMAKFESDLLDSEGVSTGLLDLGGAV
ncbi:Zn-dependent exopeptidase [Thozetella sp. PMI_491]|nr:Zn-dependent exopeptidase [Thozetella sp. PMI_491]